MIISKIIGGLGNQMFQYAASIAVINKTNFILKLDISCYQNYQLHNGFELSRIFDLNTTIASEGEVNNILGWKKYNLIRKILRKLRKGVIESNYVIEPNLTYWHKLNEISDNSYLEGYWQSEKYFSHIAYEVREHFIFKPKLEGENLDLSGLIQCSNSVGLHVRRGDYVSNNTNVKIYYQCLKDYYYKAIDIITNCIKKPIFFVFSDDIQWAKDNLKLDLEFVFVSHNTGKNCYIDMQLMSLCKHNIIANSSFSWWGAWLNINPEKIVIAPKQWFADGRDDSDLIPSTWVRV